MNNKIFLTGITGNVGSAVVEYLKGEKIDFIAGVRNIEKSGKQDKSIPATPQNRKSNFSIWNLIHLYKT